MTKLTREEIIERRKHFQSILDEAPRITITGPTNAEGQPEDSDAAITIEINSLTGGVLSPLDQLPEWAEGLGVAVVHERSQYYKSTLGYVPVVADSRGQEQINVADLEWVVKFEDEDEKLIPADHEYRMAVVSSLVFDLEAWEKDETGELVFAKREGFEISKASTLELDPAMVPDDATALDDESISEAIAELEAATVTEREVFGKVATKG